MELNQIRLLGESQKGVGPRQLTNLDLIPEVIEMTQEVSEELEKMESNQRGLVRGCLDVVGDWRATLLGN